EVGLQDGVRSTGCRRNAASTRWRLVIGATIFFSLSLLLTGGNQHPSRSFFFLFPQYGTDVEGSGQKQPDDRIVRLPTVKCYPVLSSLDWKKVAQFPQPACYAFDPRRLTFLRAIRSNLVSAFSKARHGKSSPRLLIEDSEGPRFHHGRGGQLASF